MKRVYKNHGKEVVHFFVGTEVEKTPAYGEKTLFVVDLQPEKKIAALAAKNNCTHIYIGANHSYIGLLTEDYINVISNLIMMHGFKVTFDFNVEYYPIVCEYLQDTCIAQNPKFIPMIRVALPSIDELNVNAVLKLDDSTFDASNVGVWCHSITELRTDETMTTWTEYNQDEIIK